MSFLKSNNNKTSSRRLDAPLGFENPDNTYHSGNWFNLGHRITEELRGIGDGIYNLTHKHNGVNYNFGDKIQAPIKQPKPEPPNPPGPGPNPPKGFEYYKSIEDDYERKKRSSGSNVGFRGRRNRSRFK